MIYHDQLTCPRTFPWKYLTISATKSDIVAIDYVNAIITCHENAITQLCKSQLEQYFSKTLTHFTVPVLLQSTSFTNKVWQQLMQIPYGHTASYGQIAANLGRKKGARAVGHACSINPVSIIVPCHRVISAQGTLTGYAGGLETKRWLLCHELAKLM